MATTPKSRKPMPPRKHRMKRSSLQRAAKQAAAREFFEDSHGIRFHEIAGVLGNPRAWKGVRTVINSELAFWFKLTRTLHPCFLCEQSVGIEVHHIVGGGKRSDEYCNFLLVCRKCHEEVQSQPAELKWVLLAKWKHDWANADWCRIFRLLGRLPSFDTLD